MKPLNLITLLVVIAGGLNWGLVALASFDFVAAIFGPDSTGTNLVYGLVGLAALWQLIPFVRAFLVGEARAEADVKTVPH